MRRLPLPDKVNVMLDSGAYSAWRSGAVIDLDAYIAFIKKYRDLIGYYVNLDVIPGRPNKTPTLAEIDVSAKQGQDNLRYMIANGLKEALPVYHQSERLAVLHDMLKHHDYIGIAPHGSEKVNRQWLDAVFRYIKNTGAKVKTHGFGITSTNLIHRYPWASVD
jgi:hypothetical protein